MNSRQRITKEMLKEIEGLLLELEESVALVSEIRYSIAPIDKPKMPDESIFEEQEPSFREVLFTWIKKKGMDETEVYKRAGMDRRHFAKIRASRIWKTYHPKKKTIISLCLALELNKTQASELLRTEGYSLSKSSRTDLIISYCMDHKIFDVMTVNDILDRFGEEIL